MHKKDPIFLNYTFHVCLSGFFFIYGLFRRTSSQRDAVPTVPSPSCGAPLCASATTGCSSRRSSVAEVDDTMVLRCQSGGLLGDQRGLWDGGVAGQRRRLLGVSGRRSSTVSGRACRAVWRPRTPWFNCVWKSLPGCLASPDAVLQLCLEEAAAAGHHLETYGSTDKLDLLKRNRNKFLGKRDGGARNNFLGKRDGVGRLRGINAFFGKQLAAAESGEKRNRNKFLGKRTQNDDFQLDSISTEKRSRNKFLGKRSHLEDLPERSALVVFGNGNSDKRSRNDFLGKRDQTDIKRSRNKFLGKRVDLDEN